MAAGYKTGGRQKGTPNKENRDLREMILNALHLAGGVGYLTEQAQENPGAFLTLIGKVLPTTVVGDRNNPLAITVSLDTRRQRARAEIAEAFGPVVITHRPHTTILESNAEFNATSGESNGENVPDVEDR